MRGNEFGISDYLLQAIKDEMTWELKRQGIGRFKILDISNKGDHFNTYRVLVSHKEIDEYNCSIYEFYSHIDWTLSFPYYVGKAILAGDGKEVQFFKLIVEEDEDITQVATYLGNIRNKMAGEVA